MAHMLLDGTGAFARTADAAVLDITGDIDLRARVASDDWTATANESLITKAPGPDPNRSFIFWTDVSVGNVRAEIIWYPDGTSANAVTVSSDSLGFANGTVHWVRVTLDVDNGAGGYEVKFWTADGSLTNPSAGDFSQHGSTVTGGSTTSINASNAALDIGARNGVNALAGKFYRAQILSGIDGTLVFDADFSDPTTWNCPTKDSLTENANDATVTLQGDAELVGDCPSGNRMGGTGAIRKPPRTA